MNKLEMLENKIRAKFGDSAWLFKTIGNVKGYYGTGYCEKYRKKVMFVAERPSTGGGRSREPIKMFYEALEKLHLENAHLTDFIKTRARAGKWSYKDIRENLAIFEEEIAIINPDITIALGQKSYSWLSLYLIIRKSSLEPYKLMHYSQRRDVESYKQRFIKNLKEIVDSI